MLHYVDVCFRKVLHPSLLVGRMIAQKAYFYRLHAMSYFAQP